MRNRFYRLETNPDFGYADPMKLILAFLLFLSTPTLAHDTDDESPLFHQIPAAVEKNIVKIEQRGEYRYITSNAIPNHTTGQFPNRNNPNAIQAQSLQYRVPVNPQNTGKTTQMQGQPFGVALNGIPFDPATAECYGQQRGGSPGGSRNCQWREEAIVDGQPQLGLDNSNAHVQPDGTYHYHGIPHGLISYVDQDNDLVIVGYAADGFPMVVSKSNRYTPSYKLKSGTRPSGPGDYYTGKYTQDFEFAAGSGDLDECNGKMFSNGAYAYILTKGFPSIPRCWKGNPDPSFERGGQQMQGRRNSNSDNRPYGRRPPPRHRY